jgi:hypothetical protein
MLYAFQAMLPQYVAQLPSTCQCYARLQAMAMVLALEEARLADVRAAARVLHTRQNEQRRTSAAALLQSSWRRHKVMTQQRSTRMCALSAVSLRNCIL